MAINQATRRDQTDNFLLFLCFYILPVVIVWPFSFILIAIFFFYIFGKPTSHICIDYWTTAKNIIEVGVQLYVGESI
jgi:hypothetical protein